MSKLIRFDWAIKRMLRTKANFSILEGFLTCVLNQKVKIEEILESESNQQHPNDKMNRVDILVKNEEGELILIEVQNSREYDFVSRMLYGSSKLVTEHIKLGEPYSKIKKVYCISVVYFELGEGEDYIYHGETKFTGIHLKDKLRLNKHERRLYKGKHFVSEIYPEYYIIRVDHYDEIAKTSLDQWVYFLKTEKVEKEFNAPGLKEAEEILNVMKLSSSEQAEYNRYLEGLRLEASTLGLEKELGKKIGIEIGEKLGLEKGEKLGLEKGEKLGLEKGKKAGIEEGEYIAIKKTVKEMLARGIAKKLISECTNLSLEEIDELQDELQ